MRIRKASKSVVGSHTSHKSRVSLYSGLKTVVPSMYVGGRDLVEPYFYTAVIAASFFFTLTQANYIRLICWQLNRL